MCCFAFDSNSQATKCDDISLNPLGFEAVIQACEIQPCPIYSWVQTSSWSNCSVSCGGGEQYARIQCLDTAQISVASPLGAVVADRFCTQVRPSGAQSCQTQTCPDYRFRTGDWSECSADCDGGIMTRAVACHNTKGVALADCTLDTVSCANASFAASTQRAQIACH